MKTFKNPATSLWLDFLCKYWWISAHAWPRNAFATINRAQRKMRYHMLKSCVSGMVVWRHKYTIDTAVEIWFFVTKQNKGLRCSPKNVHFTNGRDALKLRAVWSVWSVYTLCALQYCNVVWWTVDVVYISQHMFYSNLCCKSRKSYINTRYFDINKCIKKKNNKLKKRA